jgi:hypothetical protein
MNGVTVKAHLQAVFQAALAKGTMQVDAEPLFTWAEAQGRKRATVQLTARPLGWVINDANKFERVGTREELLVEQHHDGEQLEARVLAHVQEHGGAIKPRDRAGAGIPNATVRHGHLEGFDYSQGRPVQKTRAEWRELVAAAARTAKAGADTLVFGPRYTNSLGHDCDGKLLWEIYGY